MLSAVGGVVVGIVVAWVVRFLRPLRADPLSANALSLATPFVAYLLAEGIEVSGVLAVVVAGLIIGHDAPRMATGASRLQTSAVWRLVDFLLEGLVFLLIGQQLPTVVDELAKYETSTIVIAVAITVGVVLLLRPLWLVLTQCCPGRCTPGWAARSTADDAGSQLERQKRREKSLSRREVIALSWAGTRGVITLAAIFTLPAGFPDRELLHFCAFVVVLVTLIGQGLTFAPLVRRLGLRANQADLARSATRPGRRRCRPRWTGSTRSSSSSTTTSRTTRSTTCTGSWRPGWNATAGGWTCWRSPTPTRCRSRRSTRPR